MRNLMLLTLLCLFSCKKKTTTNPNPTPQIVYNALPHWITDTLTCLVDGVKPTAYWDTIYSLTANGKSYFKHSTGQYELKAFTLYNEPYSDSIGFYMCDIFDMQGNQVNPKDTLNCWVTTSRSFDKAYNVWDTTVQSIILPHNPPFPKGATIYIGKKK